MNKTRKTVSIDGKTHAKLRGLAFKRKTTISELIRESLILLSNPLYKFSEKNEVEKV